MASITYPFSLVAGAVENINQLNSNLTAITDQVNGNLETANMASAMKPINLLGAWRTVSFVHVGYGDAITGSGLRILGGDGIVANGGDFSFDELPMFFLVAADLAVAGLTPKIRVQAAVASNATSTCPNITFGIHSVSALAGGADVCNVTITSTAVASVLISAPAASSLVTAAGSEVSLPASGTYVFGANFAGAVGSGRRGVLSAHLQIRYV